jgi:hypothetical protein
LYIDNEQYSFTITPFVSDVPNISLLTMLLLRFIAQIQSVRGQDRLLIGTNTGKVDKKLDIPPAVARKPRPVDILNAGDPRGSNAQVGGAIPP